MVEKVTYGQANESLGMVFETSHVIVSLSLVNRGGLGENWVPFSLDVTTGVHQGGGFVE